MSSIPVRARGRRSLIPVFCTANIDHETLNDFLSRAYSSLKEGHERLYIVAANGPPPDPQPSHEAIEAFESPFIDVLNPAEMLKAIASSPKITDEALVILDAETSKTGSTCRLVERYQAQFSTVRSSFASAQVALDALLDGATSIKRLQNEAAIAGGALQGDLAPGNDQKGDEKAVEFENRPQTDKTWETCCKPRCGDQNPVCIPVFMTAELSPETLNNFIKRAYDRPDWPEDSQLGVRLIDSLDLAKLQSAQTRERIEGPTTSPFLHKSLQAINATVQSQLPGTTLNCVLFIILDSRTEQDQTCILATNQSREEPFLSLVRSDFSSALASLVATTCTSLNFETLVYEAASRFDGVSRSG